jgi:prefoldin subunit 5
MDFDQFGGIIAPIATIIAASSWLHNSLNKIAIKVEVMNAKLDDYGQRISRIEQELDQIRRRQP